MTAGFSFLAYETCFPLWAKIDEEDGGFDWDTDLIGVSQSIGGVSIFIMNAFLYFRLASYFGKMRLYRAMWFGVSIIFALFPILQFANDSVLRIAVVVVFQLIFFGLAAALFTATFVFINNSIPGRIRGLANGVSQSCFSLFGGVGPFAAGGLFSLSLGRELDGKWGSSVVLTNRYMIFYLITIVGLISLFISFGLPMSVEEPLDEYKERQRKVAKENDEEAPTIQSTEEEETGEGAGEAGEEGRQEKGMPYVTSYDQHETATIQSKEGDEEERRQEKDNAYPHLK